ncbi:DNA sulfur modification protein DndD [Persephonella atlantica]|uniref:DNA sulfur modification protein DndD n=1 Tax=Persephonella atlantica TaxID=2699429 RepID=A0ABS1GJL8_9AQUI|nr:DNA sulfur modification protein DndD [Persephonella atlantica]MBK3333127.1 DNA sulfur modification protein DndD [Persephonella atlantica]
MILKKIKLRNFRQYYGEQEVEFSIHPEKNITLVYGKNGAGKTSFFTALNWVLYGSSEVKIDGKLVNKKAIEEAKEKGKQFVRSEVSLTFSHAGIDYQIKREILFDLETNKEHSENVEMEKLYPKVEKIHDPLITLNPILPPNVRTYFFFDGEKIEEFSKPEHDKEVKEAVYKVLGVTIIERAISHIKDIAKEYNKELTKKSTGKLKELRNQYNSLIEDRDILEEELKNLKEERRNLEIQIEEIKGRLREIEEIEEDIKEKDRLESKLENLKNELDGVYNQLSERINSSFILIGNLAIEKSEELIKNSLQNTDEIPTKYIIKLIEKILAEKKCICEIEINPELREKLIYKKIELSKEKDKDKTEEILFDLYNKIPDLKTEKERVLNTLMENFQRKSKIKDEIDKIQRQIDELEQKLMKHDIENVKKLQNRLINLSQEYGSLKEKISSKEDILKDLKVEIETLRREILEEEKKQKEISELKKKKDLAEEILKQLEIVYEKLSIGLKKEIEEEATSIFKSLIRKKEFFQRIELSEDYILKLIDIFGDKEAKTEISAGERQVLSLSFILALAKVSKKEAPIVMDTPFGRLDPEHRQNILQEIPYLARQIVLFVTPSEMPDDLKRLIENKIGKEYELYFDEGENYTRIIKLGEEVCT